MSERVLTGEQWLAEAKARRAALDFWRLCDELTISEAACLIAGQNPAGRDIKKGSEIVAAAQAIERALSGGVLTEARKKQNGEELIGVDALRAWLKGKGFTSGFFFPEEPAGPAYLDPGHPCYAPKLAAAVKAWEAVTTDPRYQGNARTPKQNLESWLTANAGPLGLMRDDGTVNEHAIKEQISKVANWAEKGGAPETPG